jgi:hypothetical protein
LNLALLVGAQHQRVLRRIDTDRRCLPVSLRTPDRCCS